MKLSVGTRIKYIDRIEKKEIWNGIIIAIQPPNILYPSGFYTINWDKRTPGSHTSSWVKNDCQLIDEPNDLMKQIL